jgi:hypothetical protein
VFCGATSRRLTADYGDRASVEILKQPSGFPVVMPPSAERLILPRADAMSGLGGRSAGDDSFPLTEVPHLDPALRMFRAALTSRSWHSPQCAHSQRLTASCLRPLGPLEAPQLEQLREVFLSLTICTVLPAHSPLYCKNRLSRPQPESNTDFAIRVFARFRLLTSPTTIF